MMFPERYYCHDLDLIKKIDSEITRPYSDLEAHDISELRSAPIVGSRRVELWRREWIESRKDKRWMGYNEVCAYVHSDIGIQVAGALTMLLDYDSHYCRYFSNHKSTWTIELSDRYRKKLGRNATIIIDGKSKAMAPTRSQAIDIPAGVGRHRVVIKR
ncbi:MAG: hypothetical protein ACYST5_09875 [Planctomycetota bacterium]